MTRSRSFRTFSYLLASCAGAVAVLAADTVAPAPNPVAYEFETSGFHVRVDRSPQVLKLNADSLPEFYNFPPMPLFNRPLLVGDVVPAAALVHKAKQFDDGLLAAVELAADEGIGDFAGRRAVLLRLAELLSTSDPVPSETLALVGAALKLGDPRFELPSDWQQELKQEVQELVRDASGTSALGFYSWTPELQAIYRSRSVLATQLSREDVVAVDGAFVHDEMLRADYNQIRALEARCWNPSPNRTPSPITDSESELPDFALFPSGRAVDYSIAWEQAIERGPGRTADPLEELARRVQTGTVSLDPKPDSGWFDWVTWANGSLLTADRAPEHSHVLFDKDYQLLLVDLFRGAQALTREALLGGIVGGVVGGVLGGSDDRVLIDLYPGLSVEPLPEFYERRAEAYRFIGKVLVESFGDDAVELRRFLPSGVRSNVPLIGEIEDMVAFFHGAAALSRQELGFAAPDNNDMVAIKRFSDWSGRFKSDPELSRDVRSMIPVLHDPTRGTTQVLLFFGWQTHQVYVNFEKPPKVTVTRRDGSIAQPDEYSIFLHPTSFETLRPIVAVAHVKKLLDRVAFQELCDKYQTTDRILAHLE